MSPKPTKLEPPLQRLVDGGYSIEIRDGYLLVHEVPYVNARREVRRATLVSGTVSDHQIWFTGEAPCDIQGKPLRGINDRTGTHQLCDGIVATRRFSVNPESGHYVDHFHKVETYVNILSGPARAIDGTVTACIGGVGPRVSDDASVFFFPDAAASREGIVAINALLRQNKVAVVGLGGTGSYVLDLLAKTPVLEIHLFDSDVFDAHNAFRSPGAATAEEVQTGISKVERFARQYGVMRSGVIAHAVLLDEANVSELDGFDFVFLCVDKPKSRKLVSDFLCRHAIPFIDVGMDIQMIAEERCLIGSCRVTTCTEEASDHFAKHAPMADNGEDLYRSNIQVADMNCLNATLAVIKWKKIRGFYQDIYREHHSVYDLNTHQLTNAEIVGAVRG